jgi:hypothetical protein
VLTFLVTLLTGHVQCCLSQAIVAIDKFRWALIENQLSDRNATRTALALMQRGLLLSVLHVNLGAFSH